MEKSEPEHNTELFSTRRIEALTDGVFAIAMTLLVLDLAVPVVNNATNQSLWQALIQLGPNMLSFALSFVILALMWSVHMRQFEYIEHVDRRAIALNSLRLFVVILIPFTTSLNSHYTNLLIGQIFYPLSLFLLALVTYLQGLYVSAHHSFYKNYNNAKIDSGLMRSLSFVIVSALVCIATIFVGSYAFFGFLLVPVLNIILTKKA
jgi:uncharacterized membrane protein